MITIVASTNRPGSSTLKVARYYQRKLAEKGVEATLLSLIDLPHDVIKTDMYGARSEAFKPIQKLVTDTEKFIFIIPEYNGSFPGVLKVFIDACDFPQSFYDKKALLVGVSSGKYGNIRGVEHFTGVCNYINLHVHPNRIHIPAVHKDLDAEGNFTQPDTTRFVDEQLERFLKV
ncbi:NAD(P)H-dependent oxidoreductase [Mucilaginibacter sp. RS28]|uniref:NAD(P)H-dependent oxidoreductase n=1 Tax=Mucilaginibacter straminoryzae TaxID=2932774 RepID=A0A9X1X8X9_9SPHI|nr:NADPH-dependent FMN reductase [Mucilaginibacter straminoryzae]MCJ8211903.1 NAD(P)H-dependent oxidoreductase [Mucilaginibacter straminoryzae]